MAEPHEISHREIYERVVSLENKVDGLKKDTSGMVQAFQAAQGAFTVLDWIAKIAKPLLVVASFATAIVAAWDHMKAK